MYLTQTDLVKMKLDNIKNYQISDIIKTLIREHKESDVTQDMIDGINYHTGKHDILKHDFRTFYVDGVSHQNKNKTNNKILNAYHRYLVEQKVGYIAGHPVTFKGQDEQFVKLINDNLTFWFNKMFQKWLRGSSNKGKEYLYIYINDKGEFDYAITPGEQIIPVYDTQFNETLTGIIRYYPIVYQTDYKSPKIILNKVEIYDSEKVYYLVETPGGQYIPDTDYDPNPRFHIYRWNKLFPDEQIGKGWGRVPFIELRNNEESISDLKFTKSLIDNYDFNLSSFSNNLADITKAIWVLKGYEGTKLSEFMVNLNTYNAIKVNKDGGVEPKSTDIPKEAHDSHLDRIEDNIYVFGFGVNPKIDSAGLSPSGIALEYMYAGLDIKSNIAIAEATLAVHEFMSFLADYYKITKRLDYKPDSVEPVFKKHLIINESEKITSVKNSLGITSRKTALSNHPWVKDVDAEMKQLEDEVGEPIDFNADGDTEE
jgi:SPP1 family phage portal protein